MNDPLGKLFDQFLKERVYLKAITPKTKVWYGVDGCLHPLTGVFADCVFIHSS